MSKVILFQGDSITDCGRSRETTQPNEGLGSGYPMLLASRILADYPAEDYQILNRGISGNRVVDLYARWKVDALNLQPDILSILIGVNDTWHGKNYNNGVEVDRYARVYRELIEWTLSTLPNCKIVLCEPFVKVFGAVSEDWVAEIDERRAVVKSLAQEFNLTFVPLQRVIDEASAKSSQEAILRDGVHPAYPGHQVIADAWLKAVFN